MAERVGFKVPDSVARFFKLFPLIRNPSHGTDGQYGIEERSGDKNGRVSGQDRLVLWQRPARWVERRQGVDGGDEHYRVVQVAGSKDWSTDPECLRVMCLLKCLDISFAVECSNAVEASPNGGFPFLVTADGDPVASDQIDSWVKEYAKRKGKSTVILEQSDDFLPWLSLVDNEIRTAWIAHAFGTSACDDLIKPSWQARGTEGNLGPAKQSYIQALHSSVSFTFYQNQQLEALRLQTAGVSAGHLALEEVMRNFTKALQAFEQQVDRPGCRILGSEGELGLVDISLFAYLHIILSAPDTNRALKKAVREHAKLCQWTRTCYERLST